MPERTLLSAINTLLGMAIDAETRRKPELSKCDGRTLRTCYKTCLHCEMVWEISKSVSIPVIGMGGIMNTLQMLWNFSSRVLLLWQWEQRISVKPDVSMEDCQRHSRAL